MSAQEPEAEDFVVSPDATDGIGSIEFTKEEDSGYYGPSSNIAFTRNIRRALYALLSRPASRQKSSESRFHRLDLPHRPSLDVSRPSTPDRRPSKQFIGETMSPETCVDYLRFPPENEMDALVKQFFTDTGAIFPFVHRDTFLETYNHVRSINLRQFRRSWLGLLNAILTMATVTSASWDMSATDRAAKAEIFFARAKALCLDQMLSGASLETVQAMLLMSQYLQGTHRSVMTWNIHGLAVKAAFQLGLHTTASLKSHSPLERELRTRTWYACIILDRTLSMTFGRPSAIPESYVRTSLPRPFHETLPQDKPCTIADDTLNTDLFVSTITLYKIMWTVIDILYESNIEYPEHGILPVASKVLQIEHQLLEWQAALPPLLALTTPEEVQSSDEYSLGRRFRVILSIRYHNVRILAHRRMLDLYLASIERGQNYGAEDSMLRQVGERSKNICIQSACDLISIVHTVTNSPEPKRGLLGAWWFTLYYTFNATLTIVAIVLCNHTSSTGQSSVYGDVGVSDQVLKETLEQALNCLPMIDKGNKMVDKCAKFTNTLHQCLLLLERSDANDVSGKINGDECISPTSTPRTVPSGISYPYVPIPIDASHFDLGALGWDTEGFLSSLNNAGFVDGFQESDLFC
ncbi:hypothetical protein VM1G_11070 [Cytospora mali]|uniref:Xylanolytic transcriptional activator regulatory domain-containing protein n=1 Tax=Cytospora mali TaxID=578113 RepID=A0A194VJX1_CYTMA|nr:hypothetical protein VM1G_11070 [Valsa mali]